MTALVKDRPVTETVGRRERRFAMAANAVCYEGGMVALSGVGAAAVAQPATIAAGLKIVGVAGRQANNLTGAPVPSPTVYVLSGTFAMNVSATDPVTIGDVGSTVYALDDNTISKTAGTGATPQTAAGVLWWLDPVSGQALITFS